MLIKIYLNILFKCDIITVLLHQNSIKLIKLYSTLLKFVRNFSFTNYSSSYKKKYFRKYDVINDDVNTFFALICAVREKLDIISSITPAQT